MSWNAVRLDDVAATPWRNGGGVTRELLAWPPAADWQLRISVADIEADGPFSAFPGIERWFAVLEGEGVLLDMDGLPREQRVADAPLRFDGAARTGCRLLDGPTRDFNLMARPGRARLERVRGGAERAAGATHLIAAYAHSVRLAAGFGTENPVEAGPRTLLWRIVTQPAAWSVRGDDMLVMEVAL